MVAGRTSKASLTISIIRRQERGREKERVRLRFKNVYSCVDFGFISITLNLRNAISPNLEMSESADLQLWFYPTIGFSRALKWPYTIA